MSFFSELQRRNVVRVGIAYTVIAWVIAQVAEFAFESFGAPDWTIKSIIVLLLIGLPVVLIFAWVYEMTPEGLKKEKDVDRSTSITPQTGRRVDRVIIGALVVALGFFAADKYLWQSTPAEVSPAATAEPVHATPAADSSAPDKSVAVLPFIAMSDGPDDEFFADGLTEEILNSLAQLPELLVTARTSAFVFKGDDLPPIPEIAERLGVKHVVEGSVRRAGERLRVTAQLIRAEDGFHLWSNNYDSTAEDTIRVQENIAERIALALDVVLDEEKREAMRRAGLRDVEAFTLYQKGIDYFDRAHGGLGIVDGLREANVFFDQVIARVPEFPDVYVRHADLYGHLLNDDVFGDHELRLTDEEITDAYQAMVADLQAAAQHSQDRDEQLQTEVDLAFVQGNWRGIAARAERSLAGDVCQESNWTTTLANVVGQSAMHAEQTRRIIACDPLRSLSWFNLARANLWVGDVEEAIRVAQEGRSIAPGTWLDWVYARALIESGRFDEAQTVIDSQFKDPFWAQTARVLLAAKQGNREQYERALQADEFSAGANLFLIMFHAWGGDRDNANRVAAEYDAHPWGPWVLWQVTHWCACDNAFDLEATPNLARMLEDSDVAWPPRSGRVYPLKDW
jgi:TolB-like protein